MAWPGSQCAAQGFPRSRAGPRSRVLAPGFLRPGLRLPREVVQVQLRPLEGACTRLWERTGPMPGPDLPDLAGCFPRQLGFQGRGASGASEESHVGGMALPCPSPASRPWASWAQRASSLSGLQLADQAEKGWGVGMAGWSRGTLGYSSLLCCGQSCIRPAGANPLTVEGICGCDQLRGQCGRVGPWQKPVAGRQRPQQCSARYGMLSPGAAAWENRRSVLSHLGRAWQRWKLIQVGATACRVTLLR